MSSNRAWPRSISTTRAHARSTNNPIRTSSNCIRQKRLECVPMLLKLAFAVQIIAWVMTNVEHVCKNTTCSREPSDFTIASVRLFSGNVGATNCALLCTSASTDGHHESTHAAFDSCSRSRNSRQLFVTVHRRFVLSETACLDFVKTFGFCETVDARPRCVASVDTLAPSRLDRWLRNTVFAGRWTI